MSCDCPQRPLCTFGSARSCDQVAAWSVLRGRRVTFMCEQHHTTFRAGITKPIKGLDSPREVDGWRPSIVDMINLACLDLAFDDKRGRR